MLLPTSAATVPLAGRADGDPIRLALLIAIIGTIMAACLIASSPLGHTRVR
jgi:hypothetical protein